MKLPRHIAGTPPSQTGLVRADPRALTDTGDAGFGALTRLGGAISNVAGMGFDALMKRKALDNQAAAGRANSRSVDSLNEMTNAIKGLDISQNMVFPNTPKEYYSGETGDLIELPTEDVIKFREEQIAKHNGRLETLSKAMGFKGEAARLAWLEGKKNSDRETITKVSNKAQNDFQTELYLGNAENAATNGDIETANEWIDIAERSGLVGEKQATVERDENTKNYIIGLSRMGKYGEAREAVKDSPLDNKEKRTLDATIDTDERSVNASDKLQNDMAIEAELEVIDNIFTLPQDEFLANVNGALTRINDSEILPVKGENGAGKEGQRKKINDRIKAIMKGGIDPTEQFDPEAYKRLHTAITKNSKGVKATDISGPVGRGENGGVTGEQAETLARLKKFYDGADVLGNTLHATWSGAIAQLGRAKDFSKDKTENAKMTAKAQILLDSWSLANPNATVVEYETFFERIIDTTDKNTIRIWGNRNEGRAAIRRNIEEMQEELDVASGDLPTIKKGDKKAYNKLPSGARYKDSNGNISTKK